MFRQDLNPTGSLTVSALLALLPLIVLPDAAFERRVGRDDSAGDMFKAFAPYIIIVVLFSHAQITAVKNWLTTHGVWTFDRPGPHVLTPMGKPANTAYVLNHLGATGTLLFVSGLLTLIWLQSTPVLDWMVP